MKWRDFMVNWLNKTFQRRCKIKGPLSGFIFLWGPTGHVGDTNDLGRESIQRLMFVCFIPKRDLCFPGLPGDRLYCGLPMAPVCVRREPHLEQHPWAGGHDPVMLPPAPLSAKPQGNRFHYITGRQRPQSSLSFFFLFPVRVKERFTKCAVSAWHGDKREARKLPIVPAVLIRGVGIFWANICVKSFGYRKRSPEGRSHGRGPASQGSTTQCLWCHGAEAVESQPPFIKWLLSAGTSPRCRRPLAKSCLSSFTGDRMDARHGGGSMLLSLWFVVMEAQQTNTYS